MSQQNNTEITLEVGEQRIHLQPDPGQDVTKYFNSPDPEPTRSPLANNLLMTTVQAGTKNQC
jgi:hypothetical protein